MHQYRYNLADKEIPAYVYHILPPVEGLHFTLTEEGVLGDLQSDRVVTALGLVPFVNSCLDLSLKAHVKVTTQLVYVLSMLPTTCWVHP